MSSKMPTPEEYKMQLTHRIEALKFMLETPGWKLLAEWMRTQEDSVVFEGANAEAIVGELKAWKKLRGAPVTWLSQMQRELELLARQHD